METTALGQLDTKVDAIDGKLDQLVVQVTQLQAASMQRAEIEAADNRRVLIETYVSDQRAVSERLARLEASPVRMMSYTGVGIGCLGSLVSISALVFAVISWLALHYH